MSTLVIKNFPDPLHDKLRKQAARNRRSLTKEAITLIESGMAAQRPRAELPPPLKLKGGPLTIEEIEDAIADGQE